MSDSRAERKKKLDELTQACPNCGQLFPRGAVSAYIAECECGQEFVVEDAERKELVR